MAASPRIKLVRKHLHRWIEPTNGCRNRSHQQALAAISLWRFITSAGMADRHSSRSAVALDCC